MTTDVGTGKSGALDGPGSSRRRLGVAFLALAGTALLTRGAEALPRGFRQAFATANRVLAPFGLRIFESKGEHDVITVSARPRRGTEVDFVVSERPEREPVLKTTFFNDVASFERFDVERGESAPTVRTLADGPYVVFERFDPALSRVSPVVRTSVENLRALPPRGRRDRPVLALGGRDE